MSPVNPLEALVYPNNLPPGTDIEGLLEEETSPFLSKLLYAELHRIKMARLISLIKDNEAEILSEASPLVDYVRAGILADEELGFAADNMTIELETHRAREGELLFLLKINISGCKKETLIYNGANQDKINKLVSDLIVQFFRGKDLIARPWGCSFEYDADKTICGKKFFIVGPSQEMVPKVGEGTVLGSGAIGG